MPQTPSTKSERKLPAGVGFAVTELIKDGWLDDCLDLVAMCVRERQRTLAVQARHGIAPR